jgi:hypothetical protein
MGNSCSLIEGMSILFFLISKWFCSTFCLLPSGVKRKLRVTEVRSYKVSYGKMSRNIETLFHNNRSTAILCLMFKTVYCGFTGVTTACYKGPDILEKRASLSFLAA